MDKFGCDYGCKTVGESIIKYNIPDNWYAEFDAFDDVYPIVVIQVEHRTQGKNNYGKKPFVKK